MDTISAPSYASARAMLEQLRQNKDDRVIGLDLAIALGILLADNAPPGGELAHVAMAKLVLQIACNQRLGEKLMSDCVGSA